MKVLTVSRFFPSHHPKAKQETFFVEKILNEIYPGGMGDILINLPEEVKPLINDFFVLDGEDKKFHTIRAGNRWKEGDMVSLRIWSDKPYRSKQIEFAQVRIRKIWQFSLHVVGDEILWKIPGIGGGDFDMSSKSLEKIAENDGLELRDFLDWFAIHPKAKDKAFTGQILCWSDTIDY